MAPNKLKNDEADYDRNDDVKYNGRFSSEYGRENYVDIHGIGEGSQQHSAQQPTKDFDRDNYGADREQVRDASKDNATNDKQDSEKRGNFFGHRHK